MNVVTFCFLIDLLQNGLVCANVRLGTTGLTAYLVLKQWMIETYDNIQVCPR